MSLQKKRSTPLPPPPLSDPSAPAGRPRTRLVVVGAVAVAAVIAIAAGTTVLLVNRSNSSDDLVTAENLIAGTFPTEPSSAWSLQPTDVLPTADAQFFDPMYDDYGYRRAGAILAGETVVVAVTDGLSPETTIAGVDSETGSVAWQHSISEFGGCANAAVDGVLPCVSYESGPGTSTIEFIDSASGSVASTRMAPFYVSAVYADGSDLYVSGRDLEVEASVVTKGTVDDPASAWSHTYPDNRCSGIGSGDNNSFGVVGTVLSKSSGSSVIANTTDGSPIVENVSGSSVVGGAAVSASQCPEDMSTGSFSHSLVTSSGEVAFTSESYLVDYALHVSYDQDAPVLAVDGTAVDPVSGEVRWSRPDLADAAFSAALIGPIIVFPAGDIIEAVDASSGRTAWTAPNPYNASVSATDGKSFLSSSDSSLTAYSLTDGAVMWRYSIDSGRGGAGQLLPNDGGVVYASNLLLTQLDSTGPPAGLPQIESGPANASGGSGSDSYVTQCGTPPTFTPTKFTTDTGALVVTMKVTATCPGGDVLSSSATTLSISQGSSNVASAVFDMSGSPLAVPGSGTSGAASVDQDFRFPAGTFWRLPDTLPTGSSSSSGNAYVVDCERAGSSSSERAELGSATGPLTASAPAAPATGDAETSAFDALRAIANSDRPVILRDLGERWVPQLSSKKPGLVADGMTWNNSSTLAEHLDLRLRYPDVKLMWSGEWNVFSYKDFWVTAAGVTFPNPAGANNWCSTNGLDAEHCFAKLVSATHPVAGSTASR